MPKREPTPRELVCVLSGERFTYVGFGRPPSVCPAMKEAWAKMQRKKYYTRRQAAKLEARAAGAQAQQAA